MASDACINQLIKTGYNAYFTGLVKVSLIKKRLTIERFFRGKKRFTAELVVNKTSYVMRNNQTVYLMPGIYDIRFDRGIVTEINEHVKPIVEPARAISSFEELSFLLTGGIKTLVR